MSLRSLIFTGFGLLAAAMLFLAPANALERDPGIYAVTIDVSDVMLPYFAVEAEKVAVLRQEVEAEPDRMPAAAALGPIYALSLETDGQSLRRYHLRC